ncbi:MAG: hypothetical protein WDN24_19880 [Sphingomonas sp.]
MLLSVNSTSFAQPNARTWLRVSRDKGHNWSPQLPLPMDGFKSLSARESVLLRPDGTVLTFLMTVDEKGFHRQPLVYALPPRGTDFHFLSMITPKEDPKGAADGDYTGTLRFAGHRWFYPRGYLLPNGRILCVLRSQRDPRGIMWTEVYAATTAATPGAISRASTISARRQPGGAQGRPAGDGLRLSPDALGHPRQGQRGRRQDLGRRADRPRRRRSWTSATPTPGRPTTAGSA